MENRLRLAEARGSLTAPNNPVQDLALQILLMLSTKASEEQKVDMIRQAILIADPPEERVTRAFPEYFPKEVLQEMAMEKAVGEDGEFDIDKVDDSKIDWRTEVSPDEDEELARWIMERESGQVSLAELEGGWK